MSSAYVVWDMEFCRGRVSRKIRWESLKFTRIFLFDHRLIVRRVGDSKAGVSPEEIEEAKQLLEVDAWTEKLELWVPCFSVSVFLHVFLLYFFFGRSGIFLIYCLYPFRAIGQTYTKVTHDASKPLPKLWTVINSMLLWKASYWMGGLGL